MTEDTAFSLAQSATRGHPGHGAAAGKLPTLSGMRRNRLVCIACVLVAAGVAASCHGKSGAAAGEPAPLSQPGATFTVPDGDLPPSLSLIVYGDMRFTHPEDIVDTNPAARRALVAKIATEHPDALVLTGDVPFRGRDRFDYQEFATETAAWRAEHLRVYPVLGNHELSGTGFADPLRNWWSAFPELQDRRWYSVALGSRIWLVGLDSNSALTPGSPQRLWLEDQIAHLPPTVDFVFLAMHHPPVADIQTRVHVDHNPRPNEISLRDYLSGIAPKTHAQFIVSSGHIHNYERFSVDGVTYLVSGGGGARPHDIDRTPPDQYQGKDFPVFHNILFRLDGPQLQATMFRLGIPIGEKPTWIAGDSFSVAAKNRASP
jgi:acid phosphatase type 7